MNELGKIMSHARRTARRLRNARVALPVRLRDVVCLCGGELYRVLDADSSPPGGHAFQIARCVTCQLVRVLPVPTPASLYGAGYQYSTTAAGQYLVRDKPWCRSLAQALAQLLAQHPALRAWPVLDVGCNGGELVRELAALGLAAEGCDVDPVAVAHARSLGLEVTERDLCREPPSQRYSVIILNHTLEHIVPVYALLSNLSQGLVPGGLLYVRVPNFDGWIAQALGNRWSFLVPDEHVWQFTPETLRRHVLAAAPYELLELQCRSSLEYTTPAWKGQIKEAVKGLAVRFNAGDEITATFRRPER
jgi:2-polyprenyl-3-methyl-5-hydroxy-6-metoxy-1,4-benzoquinol methylase